MKLAEFALSLQFEIACFNRVVNKLLHNLSPIIWNEFVMFSRLQLALDLGVCAKVFQSIGFLNSYCSQIMSEPPFLHL